MFLIEDDDRWNRLAERFRDHNYRQCAAYATAMASRTNAGMENVGFGGGTEVTGLASVRVKPLSLLGTGIAYVSGGPLVDGTDVGVAEDNLQTSVAELKEEYVDRRGLVLRIVPCVGDPARKPMEERCYEANGFTVSSHLAANRTIVVDVDRSPAEIRDGFAAKWRRDLNRAEREPIDVSFGQGLELFEEFQGLFDELVARKELAVDLGADFYTSVQERLPKSERLHIGIARVDGTPAAGVVASILGDTGVYLLGASNGVGRRTRAAYLLQWRMIEATVERGCRWYDLGGVDPEGNPGVYRFKARMGGVEVCAPGPYECAPGPITQRTVRASEKAFRAMSRLGIV